MRKSDCRSIIIEGQDSLGKSLQARELQKRLEKKGYAVAKIKSPFNDGITYRLIYWMLANGLARKFQNVFQLIHFANKLYFQKFKLPAILEENDFVIFDRWAISMWAYGVADGASAEITEWMLRYIVEPDLTIILDGERHPRDRSDDSYEGDQQYQRKVRGMYLNWATSHDANYIGIVNANQPVYEVTASIVNQMVTKGIIDHENI
jgi:thymidylate kinase